MRRNASIAAVLVLLLAIGGAGATRPVTQMVVARAHAAEVRARIRSRPKRQRARPDLTVVAQQLLAAAVAPLVRDDDDHVAVAVDDLSAGTLGSCRGGQEFVTASIVKVDILATLLYQSQQSGQPLTAGQQWLATTMIENSDNDSASALYDEVGGAAAIDAANRVFGLTETTVGTDGYWGLTTTTVDDQIRLLRLVFTRPSVLSAASQEYIQGLMGQVEADQQWGVPAAADAGTRFMVKNGWLPNPYLWEINSIGEVVHDHQRMLIAVLSDDNASEYSGISLVETVAKAAAAAVAAGLGLAAAGADP